MASHDLLTGGRSDLLCAVPAYRRRPNRDRAPDRSVAAATVPAHRCESAAQGRECPASGCPLPYWRSSRHRLVSGNAGCLLLCLPGGYATLLVRRVREYQCLGWADVSGCAPGTLAGSTD